MNAAGYEVRNQIIWVKTVASMGWGDYRRKYEPMLYCIKTGLKPEFYADRTQTTAWDELPSDAELLETIKKMIKKDEDGNSTVWRFSRETNYVHPCLPAGEMVFAGGIWKPIEKVAIGEKTSYGEVVEASNHDAESIVEIELEDGSIVRSTENHPFLIEDAGAILWIEARKVKPGDFTLTNGNAHSTLKPCQDTKTDSQQQDQSRQKGTEGFTTNPKKDGDSSMSLSGREQTDQSQRDIRSTTRTKTSSTIILEISKLSRPLDISGCTLVVSRQEMENGQNHVNPVESLSRSPQNTGITAEDGQQDAPVGNVAFLGVSKFVRLSKRAVGSVKIIPGRIKVYNLTIDGVPAFDTAIGISHNTQKPVALVTKALINSCSTHGIVLDLFGGSGSTLIAAEKNQRRARLMEMDPSFVDVIVKRYADFCIKNGRNWCVLRNNVDVSAEYGNTENAEKPE